ncbi:MAG: hypothetical protein ACREBD_00605, partial [Blastocatellia bacterium]
MSINNPNQPAVGAGEAQEVVNAVSVAAAESAQPAIVEVAASESAATAAALGPSVNTVNDTPINDQIASDDADGDLTMEDFGKILDQHEQTHRSEISEGEVVKGRVVKITEQIVIIDVGFKSEGIVAIAEFKDGDQITIN